MTRLGIDVGKDRIRVVFVKGSRITWHGSMPAKPAETIGDAIQGSLSEARRSRTVRGSPRVCATLGPSWVQVKPLAGIPRLRNERLIAQVVRENASSFFLRTRSPIALGAIASRDDGTTWAAGYDGDVLQQVADAVRRSGMRFERALPAVTAIAAVIPNGSFGWDDGGSRVRVTTKAGTIDGIQRIAPSTNAEHNHPKLPTALTVLGSDGWSYVAAYAAAHSSRYDAFAWHPAPDPRRSRRVNRIGTAIVVVTLVLSSAAALLAPAIRATRFASRGSAELNVLRDVQSEAARSEADLRRASALIDHVARFRSSRGSVTLLLAGLAETLPESTAIVSLRIDSLEASFVALAPHVADVVPQLLAIDRIVAPRIVGSITPETINAARLERAAFRFRRPRPAPIRPSGPTTRARASSPRSADFQ